MNKVFKSGLMALAWMMAATAALAQPAGKPPPLGMPPMGNPVGKEFLFADFKRPVLKLQYPGNVEANFYVTYATVMGTRPLKMDIYRVPNAGLKPAIIFVHGGSYVNGDPRDDRNGVFGENDGFMAAVASHGYVVAAPRYRLADESS